MKLNLPDCSLRLEKDAEGRTVVFDRLRKRFVVVTPEEWVRQHFVNYLIEHKGFPEGFMANEVGLHLNGTSRRSDTVVFDINRKPLVIVEYKAPTVAISQRTFDQIVRYNMVLRASYLIVSNGIMHYCCRIDYDSNSYAFLPAIPTFGEITSRD